MIHFIFRAILWILWPCSTFPSFPSLVCMKKCISYPTQGLTLTTTMFQAKVENHRNTASISCEYYINQSAFSMAHFLLLSHLYNTFPVLFHLLVIFLTSSCDLISPLLSLILLACLFPFHFPLIRLWLQPHQLSICFNSAAVASYSTQTFHFLLTSQLT